MEILRTIEILLKNEEIIVLLIKKYDIVEILFKKIKQDISSIYNYLSLSCLANIFSGCS